MGIFSVAAINDERDVSKVVSEPQNVTIYGFNMVVKPIRNVSYRSEFNSISKRRLPYDVSFKLGVILKDQKIN